ncbi:MAG TPA: M23 family metallopeptidase [Limnochordia bacterium]|jgi:murein DD-endopeptidase MepM/ murein hydrolase activator NlpD|nr:M23 family metallopeptidase [Limnochordia bacterium]
MKKVGSMVMVLLLAVSCLALVSAEELELVWGRTYTQMLLDGATDRLWANFAPSLHQVFGSFEGFQSFHHQVMSLGTEWEVMHEDLMQVEHWLVYQEVLHFPLAQANVVFQWAYDDEGLIGALQVFELPQVAPSEFLDYETKTTLRLPFDDKWYVFWGGRTIEQNYHAADISQRFAYDFVIRKEGTTFANTGLANEDYYAFRMPIFAPGNGIVVAVQDGIPDNPPSIMNPDQPLGNYVIVDHQNGEFSFLAHFKQNSVVVKVGDLVRQNDLLGLCGNSGNSSEPHLHYHLQDTPHFAQGQGLPTQFQSYCANGQLVHRGEPTQGDLVEHITN